MDFTTAQARVDSFLATGDTNEPVLNSTVRDNAFNEAYFQYYAAFTALFVYTVDYARSGNVFNVGLLAERQWIECETAERKDGTDYVPLKRGTFGQVLFFAGAGDINVPEECGMALVSRVASGTGGTSVFRVAVNPKPSASTTYRFRIRAYPVELVNGTDVLEMEEVPCDYVCRITAVRLGAVLGYSDEWVQGVALPLPAEVQAEFDLDKYSRWPQTEEPRWVGEMIHGL